MTEVQESDPDMYLYFAYLFYRGILLFFISWKADILSTTVEILFDDYLKPAWTNIIFLFGTANIHLRYLYLLSFLIVYKVIFSVRLSWLIDWQRIECLKEQQYRWLK
jgi:hypothetical protein